MRATGKFLPLTAVDEIYDQFPQYLSVRPINSAFSLHRRLYNSSIEAHQVNLFDIETREFSQQRAGVKRAHVERPNSLHSTVENSAPSSIDVEVDDDSEGRGSYEIANDGVPYYPLPSEEAQLFDQFVEYNVDSSADVLSTLPGIWD